MNTQDAADARHGHGPRSRHEHRGHECVAGLVGPPQVAVMGCRVANAKMQKSVALLCPTMWDEAELPAIAAAGHYMVLPFGTDVSEHPETFSADCFIEDAVSAFGASGLSGVIASDDYPGSIVAAVVARRLGLPGPDPRAVLLCHHKYYSRLAQRECVPDAVPSFALLDPAALGKIEMPFPAFVKPVKSFFSIFARRIENARELASLAREAEAHLRGFGRPLDELLTRYTDFGLGSRYLLAEEPMHGRQVTLEGCVFQGGISIIGITDSIMYPGTISFERFEYPSSLDAAVQARMSEISARFIEHIGFDNGLFNIEMFYEPETGLIRIIEVNPRMCPQFADLMEKVNGVNTYEIAFAISAGVAPVIHRGKPRCAVASSFVLRVFADQWVRRVPSVDELTAFQGQFPDARVKVLCRAGARLSEELQDGNSYRYALLNLGGESRSHLLGRFAQALRMLPFKFEPVGRDAGEAQVAPVPPRAVSI